MTRRRDPVPPVPYENVVRALSMRVTLDGLTGELVAKGYGISADRANQAIDEAYSLRSRRRAA